MRHRWLTLFSIFFVTGIVFFFFWISIQPIRSPKKKITSSEPMETVSTPTVTFVNPKKGALTDPKLTIIEFGDFQCEPCRDVAESLDVLLRTIPDVQVVWKDAPNESLHPLSTPAAIAAHCAGEQGKFWEYHDQLFGQQVLLNETLFPQIAKDIGLDSSRFQSCYDNRDTLPLVKKDFEEAKALSLSATPTIFLKEERLVGFITVEELIGRVREILAAQTK